MKEKIFANNRKARHDFHIEEVFEAGIALQGTEVKSIREGRANLKDSYARVEKGELFLYNMHISPYDQGNIFNHDPLRTRKLLMHKREIKRLIGLTKEKGYTLVPLRLYLKNGKIKVELGLAKGKRQYDKRKALKEKTVDREIEKALKDRQYQ
ncbi:MAG: SsrA-binding protein SmpB [Candidatus Syntrophonatronum acetioxidans]|uniref:SsrA-binding protein n=1 Tax=Candidatus Syntrophonatronum acetioxidans TaxID=1795816 RepID=A0A424YFC2_9FIRM|nr:MAG: SsrA-binding protein SmpB [Candidatus Syntrophonatronum acetioxidans]